MSHIAKEKDVLATFFVAPFLRISATEIIVMYFGILFDIFSTVVLQIQITTLCISISLSAYVTMFCLFSPKLYIIVFQVIKMSFGLFSTLSNAHVLLQLAFTISRLANDRRAFIND